MRLVHALPMRIYQHYLKSPPKIHSDSKAKLIMFTTLMSMCGHDDLTKSRAVNMCHKYLNLNIFHIFIVVVLS